MNSKNLLKIACFATAIVAVIVSFLVFPMLPDAVPVHWNASGSIDAYGPAWMGAFLFPAIIAFVLLLFAVTPKIAIFKENLKSFEKQYWALALVLQVFFLVFYGVTLMPNFGIEFSYNLLFITPLSFLFVAIGLLMPSFKRNFFVGIRTPWTLASDRVWAKTHRFGGRLFIVFGIATLFSVALPEWAFAVVIGLALLMVAATFVYSYLVYKKIGRRQL
ncbi:MAG: SdpI family protein [Candidatus Diapherotrites archaeon]|uniref:SdpI family protein n=1 Tax=Candidatus Iainarchaeum sp. TaxID=3101447 RepID=A0A939C7F1_9ARCH|nr:SdpI family protein [Candidatus Diapherotrites archaeon]